MSGLIVVGDVCTGTPGAPRAEAVGIEAGRIVALGALADVRDRLPRAREAAPGGVIVPGLRDTHVHAQWVGRRMAMVVLDAARSIGEMQALLGTASSGSGWIEGSAGFSIEDVAEGRLPTADELESAAPGRPIFLDRKGHDALANRTALRLAGLPEEHDGLLVEHAEVEVVRQLVPPAGRDERAGWIQHGTAQLRDLGLTSIADPAVPLGELDAWRSAYDRGLLRTRAEIMPLGGDTVRPGELVAAADAALAGCDPEGLRRTHVKLFLDGGGSLGTALRSTPWPGSGSHGVQSTATATLLEYLEHGARTGAGVAVHAVGDAAIDLLVDAAARVGGAVGALPRVQIIHGYLEPSGRAMRRAAELGMELSAHPALQYQYGPDLVAQLDEEVAARSTPLRSWLDAGVRVVGGSDGPGAQLSPLFGMWQARTREIRGGARLGLDQAITAEEALRLYAPDALRVGGRGDLTAISVDPLADDPEPLCEGAILATIIGGEIAEPSH